MTTKIIKKYSLNPPKNIELENVSTNVFKQIDKLKELIKVLEDLSIDEFNQYGFYGVESMIDSLKDYQGDIEIEEENKLLIKLLEV